MSFLERRTNIVWIVGGILVAAILLGNQGFRKMISRSYEAARLRRQLQNLQKEHRVLEKELVLLQTDMSYVERLARKELGLIRPGEIEFRFVQEPQKKDQ